MIHVSRRLRLMTIVGMMALALLLVASSLPALASTSVFINEIHYDNAGTDTGEGIEVAGPAGTDLAGWSIALYNGSSSQLNVYGTINLSGVIPDQSNGYGTLAFFYAGIQNGSPDGLALVDASNNVIQFLSYEGSFTAVDGPAAGMTSTDIGVSESSSTAEGDSLQLAGTGTTYEDFHWTAASPNTFGTINTSQTFSSGGVTPPSLIINEMDADQSGTDSAEFVELYDYGVGNTDLSGLVLVFYNGSNDSSYAAFDLDGYSTGSDGYFVLCGNAANTPNCDLDVSPDTNLIQNGADAIALYTGDAADFPNGTPVTTDNLIDAIVYDTDDADDPGLLVLLNPGQPQVNERAGGNGTGHSNQRCPNGSGGARNTETYAQYPPTPGEENTCGAGGPTFGACFDPATPIHDIQGNGFSSPVVGTTQVIEGVVVGDYQDGLRGFFLQEEDNQVDADPTTSEGIFVYDNGFGTDVAVGDVVRVQGTVQEFHDLTELTDVADVAVCGSGASVTPTTVTLPIPAVSDWEYTEGMLVMIPQQLTVTSNYTLGRYGEVELSVNGRLYNPTDITSPGPTAIAQQDLNDRSRIQLDDGSTAQNPQPLPPYLGLDNTLRAGDTIPSLTGVLSYSFGKYEIQPVDQITFTRVNNRQGAPASVGGSLSIAGMNLHNYFVTLDNGSPICGPNSDQGCRGADSNEEFMRQRDKIVSTIVNMNADVIGLVEIENHPTDAALQDLVNAVNAASGPGTYNLIATGPIGDDAIKVGLIYKPARVTPEGSYAILDSSVDPTFIDTKNRPVLAQTFRQNSDGALFTVAVNHLKSKGSDCNDVGDPDTGDGQGNCNLTRTKAASAEMNWLASDPTNSGDQDFILVGDFNAYAMEDPITTFKNGGYNDLVDSFIGQDAYTYSYKGQFGSLDYALANAHLTSQVTGVTVWHINADEPAALDYNDYNQPALYHPDPYRSSDHDPVVVGLELNGPPVCTSATPSEETIWPPNYKFVPINVLNVTDPEGDPVSITIDSIFQDEPVNSEGHRKFGPDGKGVGTDTAEVRAERDGRGTGRVYHIRFTASDGQGNSCAGEVLVKVPHSQNKHDQVIDEGPLYDSTQQ